MGKRSFNPEECIGPLNNIKRGMQMTERPSTKESMLESLKGCGLPTNSTFWSVFRNSGVIQEVSKGKFMFASKDPIYVGTLKSIKAKYKELAHRYNNSNKKPKPPKEEPKDELPENDPLALTQFAIDLLKEQGYQIFAPVGVVYQKL